MTTSSEVHDHTSPPTHYLNHLNVNKSSIAVGIVVHPESCPSQRRKYGRATASGKLHYHTPNYGILTNSYPILHPYSVYAGIGAELEG